MDHESSRPGLVRRADNGRRNRKEEAVMERSKGMLFDADQIQFDDFRATRPIAQSLGRDGWSGRFWLPADDRVEPIRRFCLLRTDGRVGEMVMDRFAFPVTL
jgi:hypothetical protein